MTAKAGVPLLARKTINKMGGHLNEAVADTSMDFGRRMLAKFGWSEGKGLGRKEDGMKEHIKVKQRAENLGLGAQSEEEVNAIQFAPPPDLAVGRPKRKKADSDSDSDSESEDEDEARRRAQIASTAGVIPGMSDGDLFKACGGARLGMRARAGQDGKQKRMEAADAAFMAKFGGQKSGGANVPPPQPATTAADAAAEPPSKRQKGAKGEKGEKKAKKAAGAAEAATEDARKAAKKEARKAERKAERKAAKKAEKQEAKRAAKQAKGA